MFSVCLSLEAFVMYEAKRGVSTLDLDLTGVTFTVKAL